MYGIFDFSLNANIDILLQEYHTHHSIFSFLCCAIMCRYFLSSMLWCPLRFPHNTMFGSFLLPVVNIGVFTSYWPYLGLFTYCRVQHILWCPFSSWKLKSCYQWKLMTYIYNISVREYRRGNQKYTIQKNWQLGVRFVFTSSC
jgi:hypothetical protein